MTRITAANGHQFTPALSPDGSLVAFVSSEDATVVLLLYELSTNSYLQVELPFDRVGHPSWSADGRRLFVTARVGRATADIVEVILNRPGTVD